MSHNEFALACVRLHRALGHALCKGISICCDHVALHHSAEEYQIMGMPAPQPVTTIEELLALPDDGLRRHSIKNGVIARPTAVTWRAPFSVRFH